MLRRLFCRRSTALETLNVGYYVNCLKAVDQRLLQIIHKTELEILRVTKLSAPNRNIAKRRIMLKRHKMGMEKRRDVILARILQLENLHINTLQIDALKGVTKAFASSKETIGDVDTLLDRLDEFREDYDEINERLSEDMQFGGGSADIDEDELLQELKTLEEADSPNVQKILRTDFPAVPMEEEEAERVREEAEKARRAPSKAAAILAKDAEPKKAMTELEKAGGRIKKSRNQPSKPTRQSKGSDAGRRKGKLTIVSALAGNDERQRSLASVRRAREKKSARIARPATCNRPVHSVLAARVLLVSRRHVLRHRRSRRVVRPIQRGKKRASVGPVGASGGAFGRFRDWAWWSASVARREEGGCDGGTLLYSRLLC